MSIAAFHDAISGYLIDKDASLWLKLLVRGESIEKVFVRIEPDNEEYLIPMECTGQENGWTAYTAEVSKSRHIEQTDYLFKLLTHDDSLWLGSAGLEAHMPRNIHMFRYSHDRRLPSWTASQVFYQVFPERFANGDNRLSVKPGEYRYLDRRDIVVKQWGEEPDHATGGFEFFGGDLVGVKQKLSYLNDELGVTALYLNPVFTSQSSHKYDTIDYSNVDPHFGGNEALAALVDDAHARDMKIVLDAVINHTSVMHPWFQEAISGSEQAQQRYVFEDGDYASWKGHRGLPTLDFSNPDVLNDMIEGEDSVIRHWLRPPYNIDGWRMDVIHMLGEGDGAKNNSQYLKSLRNVIKAENPEALLLGEHFFEATAWLQGDQEDCAMNYFGFGHPVRAFFAGLDIAMHPIQLDAEQFAKWLRESRARLPFHQQLLQFNQLDSHDTPRFLSMLNGDKTQLKTAIGFLMSYIGTPCLYYGTEIGMAGDSDPGCRACFQWDDAQWDQDIFTFSKRWIELRKHYASLSSGAIVDLYAQGDVFVFARIIEGETVIVAVNRGLEKAVSFDLAIPTNSQGWSLVEGAGVLSIDGSDASMILPEKGITMWVGD
jgi:alpha-glucosidase